MANVLKKVLSLLFLLLMIKLAGYGLEHIKKLYQSLIISHFMYCSVVWASVSNINLSELGIIQKEAIRFGLLHV